MQHLWNVVFGLACLFGIYYLCDHVYYWLRDEWRIRQMPRKNAEYKKEEEKWAKLMKDDQERKRKEKEDKGND